MADSGELHELLNGPLKLGSGRRSKPIRADFAGELSVEELLHASSVEMGTKAPCVKSLRSSHHMLARLLAKGGKPADAAIITGYSLSRISILQADPTFSELLAFYRAMDEEQFSVANADMHQRLAALGFDAVEVLHERIIESPESFDNKTILAVVEAASDRTGHGKTSTVKHDHAHSLSDEAIARVKSAVQAGAQVVQADREALVRLAALRTAPTHSSSEEAEGEPSGGGGLREEGGEGDQEPIEACFVVVSSVD